ncbi:hypothetical protein V6Z11_D08G199000 [Gossypium hirsutum]
MEKKKRKWKELRTSDSRGSKFGTSKTTTLPRHRLLHGQRPPPHRDHQGSYHSHLDASAKTIEPGVIFARESHKCFAFESFVCKTTLEGFDSPDFEATKDSDSKRLDPKQHFNTFKTLKSVHPKSFLAQNPSSSLARFTRTKYLNLVSGFEHEISRRFWLLHCLGISMHEQVSIFQVKKDYSFSEIYMENVTEESLLLGEINDGNVDVRVSFTVVLGFKIGAIVIQSQVYLSPVITPSVSQ